MSETMEGRVVAPETEVMVKARPRMFTAAEKLRILWEAEGCTRPGELGALLEVPPRISQLLGVSLVSNAKG